MDQLKELIEPAREFANDSRRLVNRCTKPDRKGEQAYLLAVRAFNTSCTCVSIAA
jgi:protein transport protein SEC61 subunit gamma and related proteins